MTTSAACMRDWWETLAIDCRPAGPIASASGHEQSLAGCSASVGLDCSP